VSDFKHEFDCFLADRQFKGGHDIIMGDFNVHVENADDSVAMILSDLLYSHGYSQHVHEATHQGGHTLDLVITRSFDQLVKDISIHNPLLSDHFSVHFCVEGNKPTPLKKEVSYRKLQNIDPIAFRRDLLESSLIRSPASDADSIVQQYNSVLSELLEKHAPLKKKLKVIRRIVPWYNSEIKDAKKDKVKAEKMWRASGLTVHLDIYKERRNYVTYLIKNAKQKYYSDIITESKGDQKTLFKVVNQLLHKNNTSKLPTHSSKEELCNNMADYFVSKIEKIRMDLDVLRSGNLETDSPHCNLSHPLTSFKPVSQECMKKIIISSASKSCALDPLPTSLIKENLDIMLPVITHAVNASLTSSCVPSELKKAVVIPIIKKSDADKEVLKNYRPISNLPFLGKIIEKTVAQQLNEHITGQNMQEPMQSAYRKHHSTETALLRVQNDIFQAIDGQNCVLLVLLDLSAAFDTVDHSLLLSRLKHRFGITDEALAWIKSYLSGRKQSVMIGGVQSDEHTLTCNVPQGAVLGPDFFKDYSSPTADLIRAFGVQVHLYADDTQLYLAFKPGPSESVAVETLELCIESVKNWMAENYLKLNADKTEFMILGSRQQLSKVNITELQVGDAKVTPCECARNIGAWMDPTLKMKHQVSATCRAAWNHLRNIGKIRIYLSDEDTKRLVHSLITNKLDHNNSLLYGANKTLIARLQRIHNAAAKLITRRKKYDHVTPILKELHWLPIESRIVYKIALLVYKCLHSQGPAYLSDLLTLYQPSRALRSSSALALVVPRTRLTYGSRAFSYSGPTVWNSLPLLTRESPSLDIFKSRLKTHLFNLSF
jgi:hypothetical protein